MNIQSLQQSISTLGTAANDFGLLILGIFVLAIGIILGHFFPSKYWAILIAIGIILIVMWGILFALSYVAFILPYVLH